MPCTIGYRCGEFLCVGNPTRPCWCETWKTTSAKNRNDAGSCYSGGGDFQLSVEVTRVEKPKLLELNNPKYNDIVERYTHLKGVEMDDNDTKTMLPVHLILGASEFAKIKTMQAPRVGSPGEPVAEMTRFGWTIMFPGKEPHLTKILLTHTSQVDYKKLCQLDVLGLQDPPLRDQEQVHLEFN